MAAWLACLLGLAVRVRWFVAVLCRENRTNSKHQEENGLFRPGELIFSSLVSVPRSGESYFCCLVPQPLTGLRLRAIRTCFPGGRPTAHSGRCPAKRETVRNATGSFGSGFCGWVSLLPSGSRSPLRPSTTQAKLTTAVISGPWKASPSSTNGTD